MILQVIALGCPLVEVRQYERTATFNLKNVARIERRIIADNCGGRCVHYQDILEIASVGEKEAAVFTIVGFKKKGSPIVTKALNAIRDQMMRCLND